MNRLYLAKRQLKWAGICDIFCAGLWCLVIFILTLYSLCYLVPNKYEDPSKAATSVSLHGQAAGIVHDKGYSKLFDFSLFHFLLLEVKLWAVILVLWVFAGLSFAGKVILGTISLIHFYRGKSIQHIFAALSVIFLPMMGGIIAINTYRATTSKYAPKFVNSNAYLRLKLRNFWKISGEKEII